MAIIGTIYSKSNFDSLSDFDIQGNWDVVGGKLVTSGSDSILQYKSVSALDDFTWKVRTNSSALMVQFYGIKSSNNIRTTLSIESGKAKWAFAFNNTSGLAPSSIVIDSGDILEYEFIKSKWNHTFKVTNITNGTNTQVVIPLFSISITAHKLRLWASTALEITSLIKTSNQEFEPLNLVVGDSITYGSNATTATNRWTDVAAFKSEGTPGDTSAEAIQLISEIVNIIKPKRVIYAFGTNDLDIEVWKTNIQSFANLITQRSIVFIPITPYANSNRDMTAYQAYIQASFEKYFDIFSVTKQSGNSNMKPEYNSGDNIHPNNAGHQAIGDYVLASPYYTFEPIVNQDSSALFASIFKQWYI